MKKEHIEQLETLFDRIYEETGKHHCANDYLSYDDMDLDNVDFDSIVDELDDKRFFDVEIIYYDTAINYLMENDNSLRESLGYAENLGFTPGNLSSEILASLLASENFRNDFYEYENEVNELLNELREVV